MSSGLFNPTEPPVQTAVTVDVWDGYRRLALATAWVGEKYSIKTVLLAGIRTSVRTH